MKGTVFIEKADELEKYAETEEHHMEAKIKVCPAERVDGAFCFCFCLVVYAVRFLFVSFFFFCCYSSFCL
jgi:hypothetical protein